MTTELNLEALKAAADAADNRPWDFVAYEIGSNHGDILVQSGADESIIAHAVESKNGRFIQFADPSTILALIARLEAAEANEPKFKDAIKMLGYELDGVIIDTEQGHGFDDVCLETIKRVRTELHAMSEAAKAEANKKDDNNG